MKTDLSKYKDTFLSEARKLLALMNRALLKLEKEPGVLAPLNDVFRASHTLKSMAATMKYDKMAELCHVMEDVLAEMKQKNVKPDECIDTLFECFDALESSLETISRAGEEGGTDNLVEKLQSLLSQSGLPLSRDPQAESSAEPGGAADERPPLASIPQIDRIEVKVEQLDLLMNLTEELLISKLRLEGIKDDLQDPELGAAVDTLDRLVSDLQHNVMQARMVPISFIFNRFERMVRDLAKQEKKEVDLMTTGADIELDRVVIEQIAEPLVHLLRNAVDHGIERPAERTKAGKPARGTITLTARRVKGSAVIEVTDDGAGLDVDDIRKTAVERGILSADAAGDAVLGSVFSGVSTTKEVTAVSGRGFGLNIAKRVVESLGGSVKVASPAGQGATFTIEIPLTLAIISALFVEAGGCPYAIPLANIDRLITVDASDIKGMMNYEAIVLNEEDIAVTRLDALFGSRPPRLDKQPMVIVKKGDQRLAVAVDTFRATQEVVIKPLNRLVRENRYFAGSCIIGSGEVVLILDTSNLVLSKRQTTGSAAPARDRAQEIAESALPERSLVQ